jgi:hypothetical protein
MYQVLREAQSHRKHETMVLSGTSQSYTIKQGSLPSYTYGFKLAKLAETLRRVTFNDISQAGKIRFDKGELFGSTPMSDFYDNEKDYFSWLSEQIFPIIKNNVSSNMNYLRCKEYFIIKFIHKSQILSVEC